MRKLVLVISIMFITICLYSCNNNVTKEDTFYSFSTFIDLSITSETEEKCDEVISKIKDLFQYLDKEFDPNNRYDDINNIYVINHTNEYVKVSDNLFNILKVACEMTSKTLGFFNPFMGKITYKYKELLKKSQLEINDDDIPTNEFLLLELEIANNTSISFNDEKKMVKRNGKGLIDLGAIAKGYALEATKEIINEYGIKTYLINAGTSSIMLGEKNSISTGSYYNIGIKNIDDTILKVKNKDVGTSSILEQYVDVINGQGKKRYHHIINPKTGFPENMYDIITLIGSDSLLLDVFSTAFISMSLDDIKSLSKDNDFDVIIYKDNNLVYSSNEDNIYE